MGRDPNSYLVPSAAVLYDRGVHNSPEGNPMNRHYNPERRTWKGRSYHRGGRSVRALRARYWGADR